MQVFTCIYKRRRAAVRWWVTGGSGARPGPGSDQVVGFRRGGGQGRPGRAEGAQVLLGAAVEGEVGQEPAEQRGELEAVRGAEGDQDPLVAGERAEHEVAVGGQGVQAGGGGQVRTGRGGQAGAQEAGQPSGRGRVGLEPAGPGGDLAAADVLGGLERGAGPHREP
jgi:hypothetical protein